MGNLARMLSWKSGILKPEEHSWQKYRVYQIWLPKFLSN